MSLLVPLGLLGLLGIIALILIYILKPKYQERKISSTFVWKLSLTYKKKKIPLEWLTSSLLFFVQVLTITLIAFMLAQPLIALPVTSGDKIVILDASASMLTEDNGVTRFDRAKKEINNLAQKMGETDRFSLIYAAEGASTIVERTADAIEITNALDTLKCTLYEADIESAMLLANDILKINSSADVILYTDSNYQQEGYVNVINMTTHNEWNVAILNADARFQKGRYAFYTEIGNYGKSADIIVKLSIDGGAPVSKTINLGDLEVKEIAWENPLLYYSYAKVELDVSDNFKYDNVFELYGGERVKQRVQIVSDLPKIINSAVNAAGDYYIRSVPEEVPTDPLLAELLKPSYTDYNLYIYDHYIPSILPIDGAVWMINPEPDKALPAKTGLRYKSYSTFKSNPIALTPGEGTSALYNGIMNGINLNALTNPIKITQLTTYESYNDCEVIMRAGDTPAIFAKNIDGNTLLVFAFPLSYSTFPISYIWSYLTNNICKSVLNYTIENYVYNYGQTISINTKPNATEVEVLFGTKSIKNPAVTFDLELNELGVYTIKQTLKQSTPTSPTSSQEKFFVRVSRNESDFALARDFLASEEYVNPDSGGTIKKKKGINDLDLITYLAIGLLVLLLAEWGLQYRELF